MSGFLLSLGLSAAIIAAVFGFAVLLVAGSLAAAALFPRGHRHADRLRNFAGELPKLCWRAVLFLDGAVFVGAVVLAVFLTVALS